MKAQVLIALSLLAPAGSALAQHPTPTPHPEVRHEPHSCGPNLGPNPHGANHQGYGIGNYDLTFDMHGQQNSAVLRIVCEESKLLGKLEVHGMLIDLEVVGVEDMKLTLSGGSEFTLTLTFKNEQEFTGTWERSGDTGTLTGSRQKS